jgi:hypothetical protein
VKKQPPTQPVCFYSVSTVSNTPFLLCAKKQINNTPASVFLFPLLLFLFPNTSQVAASSTTNIHGAYAKMQTWEQDADALVLGGSLQEGGIVVCGGLLRLE